MSALRKGQKWVSAAEPDLGMGRIVEVETRLVTLEFDISEETRTYAVQEAPLTRVRFSPGDEISTADGLVLEVTDVSERDGLLFYHGKYQGTDTAIPETELDPFVRFSKPEDRLFTSQIDDNKWFHLRHLSLAQRARLAENDARGLIGPRVSLISHQVYIAGEVTHRHAPRVLLADEVGLGKTIEAGMVIHHQVTTGRAGRVLVIVPPSLVFQWFVEMIRRFNLQLVILDEERCQQIEQDNEIDEAPDPDFNPFEAQQFMLCSIDLFTGNPKRVRQVMGTEWDLLVVDEAHHLEWTEADSSLEYDIVEAFSSVFPGLLLLTATPEQLGQAGHFARLRLLDPSRFHDIDAWRAEESDYAVTARLVDRLQAGDEAARDELRADLGLADADDHELTQTALDRHGTGRVLFRNVRGAVEGFPERLACPELLPLPRAYQDADPWFPHRDVPNWTSIDPRVTWLEELEQTVGSRLLVICAHQDTAIELEKQLKADTGLRVTAFHEGMDLVARDRAAAWFAEEGGAQLLVCSEIGSEGRNFQFAHHIVLFDLPPSPDLVEQRIGRLDRIGQRETVRIHVPCFDGHLSARYFRWLDEGIGLFTAPNAAAEAIFQDFRDRLAGDDLATVISDTVAANHQRQAELAAGRDRLLELNSHDPELARELMSHIRDAEGGLALEDYMEASFDAFGLESEPLHDRVMLVKPTEQMVRHSSVSLETLDHFHYPELPEDGIRYTYDRSTALAREDLMFFTWENPVVQQALDAVIADVTGNSCVTVIRHPRFRTGSMLVEAMFVVSCIAPPNLGVDRYLPPHVIRRVIHPEQGDVTDRLDYESFEDVRIELPPTTIAKVLDTQADAIRDMLHAASSAATAGLAGLQQEATAAMQHDLSAEIARLRYLKAASGTVRDDEIDFFEMRRELSLAHIEAADLRLDAIRVIVAA